MTSGAEACAFKPWDVPELVRAPFGVTGFHNSLLCLLIIVPSGKILGQKGGGSRGSSGPKANKLWEKEGALPVLGDPELQCLG